MDVLAKLFGNPARVKMLKLFLFNEGESFQNTDIAQRARVSAQNVRTETLMMEKIGLVKRRIFYIEASRGKGRKRKAVKKKVRGWTLNSTFTYLQALRSFFLTASPAHDNSIVRRLNRTGKYKLIIIAGVFIQDWDSRIDLLVVGDAINQSKLESVVRDLEADIGRELRFASFSTKDFTYRMNIYDRLIRDVLDYPHQVVLNRLGDWYASDSFVNPRKTFN